MIKKGLALLGSILVLWKVVFPFLSKKIVVEHEVEVAGNEQVSPQFENELDLEEETGSDDEELDENEQSDSDHAESLVDVNKANLEELKSITGVGDDLASKIIAEREENGLFKSEADLLRVTGIGEKKLQSLQSYIEVKEDI
ncbi:ComEA family DNA-binding protein [Salipaludibacillus keqinensis]|nr:helix-hairpin-helix domain-containing protein [Salipaludibacillus keqinensis]